MSLESTDYLIDLLQELDEHFNHIRLHHDRGVVELDDLGTGAFEVMAQIADAEEGQKTLTMHTPLPCIQLVWVHLKENDAGLWDVRVETGAAGAELRINDILGRLKEMYG